MPSKKLMPSKPAIYSPTDVKKLVTYLKKQGDAPKAKVALLYVVLGAFAGLRPTEIVELEWSAIDFVRKQIYLVARLSGVARTVPLKPNLFAFLAPYKGSKGRVITSPEMGRIVGRYWKEAGVEQIPNGLRHSYGTYRLAESHELGKVVGELGSAFPTKNPKTFRLPTLAVAKRYFAIGL